VTDQASAPRIERVHCNSCGQETKHEVIAQRRQEGSQPYDDHISIWWVTTYTLFECCGCETVCLRKEFHFSEWDNDTSQVEFFPPAMSRDLPVWSNRLPQEEQELLTEIYRALAAGSARLVLMGARTLVDMFMLRQIGDVGGFGQKLKKLQDEGYLSSKNREVLAAALDAGSASAHRGYKPSAEHLSAVMDIVENVLHADLLREDAGELRNAVPPRRPK
jgi:hypothetical protein